MKKITQYILLILLCVVGVASAKAESKNDRLFMKHELRVGWGDQLFESLVWHEPVVTIVTMPADRKFLYKEDLLYSQHVFLEYQYRFNHWFGLGGMLDGSGVEWSDVTRNGQGVELSRVEGCHFYNLVLMPTARFTYVHHANVNLYSGLGAGMCVNGGTEVDAKGHHLAVAPALNFTVLGLSVNYKQVFLSVEYGGMYAFRDKNTVYMAKSRMLAASLGVRF